MTQLMRKPVFGRRPSTLQEIAVQPVAEKHRSRSRIVRFVHDERGWRELLCAPIFMYPRVGRTVLLPAGRYIAGSVEHIDRRRELGFPEER